MRDKQPTQGEGTPDLDESRAIRRGLRPQALEELLLVSKSMRKTYSRFTALVKTVNGKIKRQAVRPFKVVRSRGRNNMTIRRIGSPKSGTPLHA